MSRLPYTDDPEYRTLERSDFRLTAVRVLFFFLFLAAGALLFWEPRYALIGIVVLIAAFVGVLRVHERVRARMRRLRNSWELQREEDLRITERLSHREPPDFAEEGSALQRGLRVFAPEPAHFDIEEGVADDLQILRGSRALFGFLDVSSTTFGARRLRYLLTHPLTDPDEIRVRQEVVSELASDPQRLRDLLEELYPLREISLYPLLRIYDEGPTHAGRRVLSTIAHTLGTIVPLLLVAYFFYPAAIALFFALLVGNFALVAGQSGMSNPRRDGLLLFRPMLEAVPRLVDVLERNRLDSTEGKQLTEAITSLKPIAASLLPGLRWLAVLRQGMISELLNLVFLAELRLLPIVERRLYRHRDDMEEALGALGELEALLSFAMPLAEQKDFEMPELVDDGRPRIVADEIAHPLLPPERVVRNALELGEKHDIAIITGSNMAGKSTYLRAIGCNLILAQAGAPVCARRFRFTPVRIYTDVNVRDSLDDGKSYFQVEVERVQRALDVADRGIAILAIFDELFRGTNSVERHAISAAVVRRLRDCGALLVLATHDLRLTELVEKDREPRMANFHFSDLVDDSGMTFDYVLRAGVGG